MSGSKKDELLGMIPTEGFVKVVEKPNASLSKEQRTSLVRKGNELFNQGDIATARKIFITTGYKDGLIRLGDHYYRKKQVLEAFRMYQAASYKGSVNTMIEKMAMIIKSWLKDKKEG
jgi:hypothetical protein